MKMRIEIPAIVDTYVQLYFEDALKFYKQNKEDYPDFMKHLKSGKKEFLKYLFESGFLLKAAEAHGDFHVCDYAQIIEGLQLKDIEHTGKLPTPSEIEDL